MEIWYFSSFLFSLEISVEEWDSQEESLVITLEISEDFNHPVDHPWSESPCDLVSTQTVSSVELNFQFSLVLIYFQTIISINVVAFSFDFCCLFNFLLPWWVVEDLLNCWDLLNMLLECNNILYRCWHCGLLVHVHWVVQDTNIFLILLVVVVS